jgi:hypothetical protein
MGDAEGQDAVVQHDWISTNTRRSSPITHHASLRFDANLLDDPGHPLKFRALDLQKSLGRAGRGFRALLLVAIANVLRFQEFHGIRMDLCDQVPR